LWSFGIFFPFWYVRTNKNLATLASFEKKEQQLAAKIRFRRGKKSTFEIEDESGIGSVTGDSKMWQSEEYTKQIAPNQCDQTARISAILGYCNFVTNYSKI
jgi:hypothetical protein